MGGGREIVSFGEESRESTVEVFDFAITMGGETSRHHRDLEDCPGHLVWRSTSRVWSRTPPESSGANRLMEWCLLPRQTEDSLGYGRTWHAELQRLLRWLMRCWSSNPQKGQTKGRSSTLFWIQNCQACEYPSASQQLTERDNWSLSVP